jgi:hypothetical protein
MQFYFGVASFPALSGDADMINVVVISERANLMLAFAGREFTRRDKL